MAEDGWRYIAQRFDGTGSFGTFLDFNVPLQDVNIDDVLSGHNGLSGTIAPEYPNLKGPDGRPLLEEGSTAIWAESPDGEILGGGIVSHSAFGDGGTWDIECVDLTGTSIDLPYDSANFFINVDPMDLFRFIWTHIQAHPNHRLGMSIDPTTSPVRLGTELVEYVDFDTEGDPDPVPDPEPPPLPPSRYSDNNDWLDAAIRAMQLNGWPVNEVRPVLGRWLRKDELIASGEWKSLNDRETRIRDRAIQRCGWPPNPPSPGRPQETLVVNVRPDMRPPTGGEVVDPQPDPVDPGPTYQYDAYKLNWYENLDLSSTLDDLAANTPFDWHLTHRWENDQIKHHIRLGYPRLGRRREDLRFVVGENIHQIPTVERDGTAYANEVIVYGAGEGAAMVIGRAFRRDDGRVRKVAVVAAPWIKHDFTANAHAEAELAKRFNIEDIAEVTLVDHPHARLGAVDLGDEIFVEGDIGWLEVQSWCRVVGRTFSPDDGNAQVLSLIRSDRIG